MNNAVITFSFAGLPAGYCYTSPERFALDIAAGLQGYLPGSYSTIVRSETEPVATDRDKVWVQVNADGAFTGKTFTYAYGKWVMLNPRRNPAERVWFEGSESDAWSYDGGDGTDPTSNPPTATTGAMWEVDHNYDFRFPLGAGTSPKPTTVSVGDTGGEEDHELDVSEFPASFQLQATLPGHRTNTETLGPQWLAPAGSAYASVTNPATEVGTFNFSNTGGGQGITNMPPYRAGYWLKPTNRQYFTP